MSNRDFADALNYLLGGRTPFQTQQFRGKTHPGWTTSQSRPKFIIIDDPQCTDYDLLDIKNMSSSINNIDNVQRIITELDEFVFITRFVKTEYDTLTSNAQHYEITEENINIFFGIFSAALIRKGKILLPDQDDGIFKDIRSIGYISHTLDLAFQWMPTYSLQGTGFTYAVKDSLVSNMHWLVKLKKEEIIGEIYKSSLLTSLLPYFEI